MGRWIGARGSGLGFQADDTRMERMLVALGPRLQHMLRSASLADAIHIRNVHKLLVWCLTLQLPQRTPPTSAPAPNKEPLSVVLVPQLPTGPNLGGRPHFFASQSQTIIPLHLRHTLLRFRRSSLEHGRKNIAGPAPGSTQGLWRATAALCPCRLLKACV